MKYQVIFYNGINDSLVYECDFFEEAKNLCRTFAHSKKMKPENTEMPNVLVLYTKRNGSEIVEAVGLMGAE